MLKQKRVWVVALIILIVDISPSFSEEIGIGISYCNRGEYEKCAEAMKEILKGKEDASAYRYLVFSLIKMKRYREALLFIERWKRLQMEEASRYERWCRKEMEKKFIYYRLSFQSLYQYDSNVGFLPDDPSLRALFAEYFEKKYDNRWAGIFSGSFGVNPQENLYAGLFYNFYQSLHAKAHNINFQSHRAGLEGRWEMRKNFLIFFSGFYSRVFISTHLNSFSEGGGGEAGIFYRAEPFDMGLKLCVIRNAYYEDLPPEMDRDGWVERIEPSMRWGILPGIHIISAYLFENSNTEGPNRDYIGHTFKLGVNWRPMKNLFINALPYYTYRHFRHPTSFYGKGRADNEMGIETAVEWRMMKWLSFILSYAFYLENSNIEVYDYRRSIVGAGIGLRVE